MQPQEEGSLPRGVAFVGPAGGSLGRVADIILTICWLVPRVDMGTSDDSSSGILLQSRPLPGFLPDGTETLSLVPVFSPGARASQNPALPRSPAHPAIAE